MGRYYWDKKETVEEYRSLSVYWLNEHGYFNTSRYGGITWTSSWGDKDSINFYVYLDETNKYINLVYKITNVSTQVSTSYDYNIELVTTPCNFGGVRFWFICPLVTNGKPCQRRVGVLYTRSGLKYFACRHCYNLSYYSRNENKHGLFGYLGKYFNKLEQVEQLASKIKMRYRAGKTTKKYQQLLDLETQIYQLEPYANNMEKLLYK